MLTPPLMPMATFSLARAGAIAVEIARVATAANTKPLFFIVGILPLVANDNGRQFRSKRFPDAAKAAFFPARSG